MKQILALTSLLVLAACNAPKPPSDTEGQAAKKVVDASTTAYANCISEGAKTIDVSGEAAGTLGDRVVLACKPQRNKLMADIIVFHQIGHPKDSIAQSKAVAEASVATAEDTLRTNSVVTIVTRQTSASAKAK